MGSLTYGDDLYAQKADVEGLGGEFTVPAAYSDAEVNTLIQRASSAIDMFTRNHFGKTPLVIELSGDGTTILVTKQVTSWPIVTITEVLERDYFETAWTDGSVETVPTSQYSISRSKRALLMAGEHATRTSRTAWSKGHRNYRVTGTFGRKAIPPLIKWACVLLVREYITPGWVTRTVETMQSEHHADGYSYVRSVASSSRDSTTVASRTTGTPFVDRLLAGYAYTTPAMVVPGG